MTNEANSLVLEQPQSDMGYYKDIQISIHIMKHSYSLQLNTITKCIQHFYEYNEKVLRICPP